MSKKNNLTYLKKWQIRYALASCIQALADLQKSLFIFYFKKNTSESIIHKKKSIYFEKITQINKHLTNNNKKIIVAIEELYAIIITIHQLRYRISDYATFEVCHRELRSIEKNSITLMHQIAKRFFKKNHRFDLENYIISIQNFENVYEQTLQVITRDPIVFLFFIHDLYIFKEIVKKLSGLIHEI